LLVGTVLVVGMSALIVAVSTDLLDALDITPETWRIAAGIVVGIAGIRVLALPQRAEEPELQGMWRALVPVAFPLLFTPELVALVTIYGSTESAGHAIAGVAVAAALGLATGVLVLRRPSLWLATARFLGAVLILGGIALVIEGIRDV
jgi:small neutral amino acid transporter SnatA (MarC family)